MRLDEDGVVDEAGGLKVLKPENILGRPFADLIPCPGDRAVFLGSLRDTRRTGIPISIIVPVRAENDIVRLDITMRPKLDGLILLSAAVIQ